MKKAIALVLSILLVLSIASSALALNYSGCQNNPATFETLEETRVSSPIAVQDLETNVGKTFVSHPALDNYPLGTTFVYRSANLFGGRAAARLNTDLLVFADKHFDDKDAAFDYLKTLGVIEIIDRAVGSVILVTPADGKAFGAADQKNYYALQTAICAQKQTGVNAEGKSVSYSDAEYFGNYGYLYVVGIDGGATFLNNYVVGNLDFVGRIAGLLLVNGEMDFINQVATFVPTYLVNAPEAVVAKYQAVNGVDTFEQTDAIDVSYNLAFPLRRVVIALEDKAVADYIEDAYYNLFIHAMRTPVMKQGLHTAGTPYQGYDFDQAPYSLCDRNAVIDGVTEDGIYLTRHDSDELFSDIKMGTGAYLQTWFEYLPEEVLNNTAPAGSVPLFLANHGGGDDPRVFVDEIGLLELAGRERIAIVAPEEQNIWSDRTEGFDPNGICCEVLPLMAKYMLDTYPALDASRVYVMGYSMGGGATLKTINGDPTVFAAGAVMAASSYVANDAQRAVIEAVDFPVMFMTSAYEFALVGAFDSATQTIATGFQKQINLFLGYNDIDTIEQYDFETYPMSGFKGDRRKVSLINGEHYNRQWYMENDAGVPMVVLNITEDLVHALYPEYAEIFWDYAKHFSRNPETFELYYNPFVD